MSNSSTSKIWHNSKCNHTCNLLLILQIIPIADLASQIQERQAENEQIVEEIEELKSVLLSAVYDVDDPWWLRLQLVVSWVASISLLLYHFCHYET